LAHFPLADCSTAAGSGDRCIASSKPQPQSQRQRQVSHYELHGQDQFNQPQHYPIGKTVPSELYRPVGNWVGRLILPSRSQSEETDWVWLQVQQAPVAAKNLVGKTVRLEWSQKPEAQAYVRAVTRDVNFTEETRENVRRGMCIPIDWTGGARWARCSL
jgi:predicted Abi (CAAX) family protease